jgi:hypothetical protein
LNESSRNSRGIWYLNSVTVKKDKLPDGTVIDIRLDDIMIDFDDDKSLGFKINVVCTFNKPGASTPRYSVYKVLSGPSKGSILFNEETFVRGKFSVTRTSNWYSELPKVYTFKSATVDAKAIPDNLKNIYHELVQFVL